MHPAEQYFQTDDESFYVFCLINAHPEGQVSREQFEVLGEELLEGDVDQVLDGMENVLWYEEDGVYRLNGYSEEVKGEMKLGEEDVTEIAGNYLKEAIESIDWSSYKASWP